MAGGCAILNPAVKESVKTTASKGFKLESPKGFRQGNGLKLRRQSAGRQTKINHSMAASSRRFAHDSGAVFNLLYHVAGSWAVGGRFELRSTKSYMHGFLFPGGVYGRETVGTKQSARAWIQAQKRL